MTATAAWPASSPTPQVADYSFGETYKERKELSRRSHLHIRLHTSNMHSCMNRLPPVLYLMRVYIWYRGPTIDTCMTLFCNLCRHIGPNRRIEKIGMYRMQRFVIPSCRPNIITAHEHAVTAYGPVATVILQQKQIVIVTNLNLFRSQSVL